MIADTLAQPPHNLPVVALSIDDLYRPRKELTQLAETYPSNPLIQHRGQPSTHDLPLALSVFDSLRKGEETRIPNYDKSAFSGEGDRVTREKWEVVNRKGESKVKIVILEGWCVGFRPLPAKELEIRWTEAGKQRDRGSYQGRLGWTKLTDLAFVNTALIEYEGLTWYDCTCSLIFRVMI